MSDPLDCPPLPGRVTAADAPSAAYDALGRDLASEAAACVENFGDFHLAVSGGTTPLPFYETLAERRYRSVPWAKTHLWLVDERRVPVDDERRNWRAVMKAFGSLPIPPSGRHPIPAEDRDAAARYESELAASLRRRPPGENRLDFVVLGMGADGHTASLFPGAAVLAEKVRLIADGPAPAGPGRVTMTFPLLNSARRLAVLVTGPSKAAMLARVANGAEGAVELPIKGLAPRSGALGWYLDRAACGR